MYILRRSVTWVSHVQELIHVCKDTRLLGCVDMLPWESKLKVGSNTIVGLKLSCSIYVAMWPVEYFIQLLPYSCMNIYYKLTSKAVNRTSGGMTGGPGCLAAAVLLSNFHLSGINEFIRWFSINHALTNMFHSQSVET